LNRAAGLVLDDCRSVSYVTADGDVVDPEAYEIAAPELTVDGKVEHRQITPLVFDL
jgi:hypothetical protein